MSTEFELTNYLDTLRSAPSLAEAFYRIASGLPDSPAYSYAVLGGTADDPAPRRVVSVTFAEAAKAVSAVARYLAELGVGDGSRVAIVSYTRPEWMIADLGILAAGATSVSVYHSINAAETGYILYDSAASVVFVENQEQLHKVLGLTEREIEIPATEDRPAGKVSIKLQRIIAFEEVSPHPLVIQLSEIIARDPDGADHFLAPAVNRIASLVYTSGTTGPPKGVIQLHSNHLANLWQAARTGLFAPSGDIFLFLPLAHSFARLIGYIGFLTPTIARFPAVADRRSSILNAPSVMRDLRDAGAEVVPIVPRILEKMREGVEQQMHGLGLRAVLLRSAVHSRQRIFAATASGQPAAIGDRLLAAITSPICGAIKRKLFGAGFRHAVSGGAKLPVEVNRFFAALGVTIYQGYGLTESCVATNVNRIGRNKLDSVGPCLELIEIKIVEDGEICFRGPNIAAGYLNRQQATAATWDSEGWLHTGDIGHLDGDGYLYIDGRKKELIVTSGGKKIAPQAIEEALALSPFIAHAVLVGDGRKFCSALLLPNTAHARAWAAHKGITLPPKLSESPELQEKIQREVDAVNARLSQFETVKKFRLIDEEPTVENGMLTPTFKVKRRIVEKRFAEAIESMYS